MKTRVFQIAISNQ